MQNMRSNNYASMAVTAPSGGYDAGELTKVEDTIGVVLEAADEGATAVLVYKCEKIVVAKVAAASDKALAVGDKVYFDATNKAVDNAASTLSFPVCGRCTKAAATTDTTVEIDLDGTLA